MTGKDGRLTPAESRARRRRSIAIGLGLAALVVVFYLVSLAKLASNVAAS